MSNKHTSHPTGAHPSSLKKRALWSILFVGIAALTIWALTSQNEDFSFVSFLAFLTELHPGWLAAAFVSMLAYIFFEGAALHTLHAAFGYKKGVYKDYSYAAADIYFSAITPSATGGQPASAFLMIKDGIPGSVTTVILLINLVMYAFAIVFLGIFCFILSPSTFQFFGPLGKALIIVGIVMQLFLATFFILLLKKPSIMKRIGNAGISLLVKIKILRNPDRKRAKLAASIASYEMCVEKLGKKRMVLLRALIYNILQRAAFVAVVVFTCFAFLGTPAYFAELWAGESMVILASNYIPIPGAMGISDTLMLDAFRGVFSPAVAANVQLLSRAISFYLCVLLCGITTLVRCVRLSFLAKKNEGTPCTAEETNTPEIENNSTQSEEQ